MNDLIISWVRTIVPVAVANGVTWLAVETEVVIDPATSTSAAALAVLVVTGVYYAIARTLERRWPFAGVLLGARKAPVYGAK